MSSLGKSLLVLVIAIGLSGPAFAQPKADAGSGPTSGADRRLAANYASNARKEAVTLTTAHHYRAMRMGNH
jgi:hypothetical protein